MDKKIEVLYDHYKDTCEIQRANLKVRNTAFVVVIVFLGIQLLLSYAPDTMGAAVLSFLNHEYGVDAEIQFGLIQSLIWVILLYSSMRYYQSTINIEKIYNYIHKTEERLNQAINCRDDSNEAMITIDREGKSYLSYYPICSDTMDIMYKWIFPVLYVVALSVKIVAERRCTIAFALDIVIYIASVILCILYMQFNYQVVKSYHCIDEKGTEEETNNTESKDGIDESNNKRVCDYNH